MKSEDESVSDEEIVLRLVWQDFYKSGDPVTIKPRAFYPRPDELTGISVFRLACLGRTTDVLLAIRDPVKRPKYLVVGLPVSELKKLGLNVVPDRIETVPGHALLAELNIRARNADRSSLLDKAECLADLAGLSVLHRPA